MFRSGYSVSLCRSVYCLCVNVYCTTATGCQPKCSYQNISCHIVIKYPKAACTIFPKDEHLDVRKHVEDTINELNH